MDHGSPPKGGRAPPSTGEGADAGGRSAMSRISRGAQPNDASGLTVMTCGLAGGLAADDPRGPRAAASDEAGSPRVQRALGAFPLRDTPRRSRRGPVGFSRGTRGEDAGFYGKKKRRPLGRARMVGRRGRTTTDACRGLGTCGSARVQGRAVKAAESRTFSCIERDSRPEKKSRENASPRGRGRDDARQRTVAVHDVVQQRLVKGAGVHDGHVVRRERDRRAGFARGRGCGGLAERDGRPAV